MKKNILLLITFAIIIILLIVLLISKKSFSVMDIDKTKILSDINTSGASILYTKDMSSGIKNKMKKYYKKYRLKAYSANMNLEEINNLLKDYSLSVDMDTVFILFMNGEPVDVVSASDDNKVVEIIEKHLYNIIPESERAYKVLPNSSQFLKKVNSKDYTVAVFGMKDCTYCDLYLLVVNKIAVSVI